MNFIPREAYSYWPSGDSSLIERKNYVERLVFYRQNFKDWEISALAQLDKLIKNESINHSFDSCEKLRFLYGTGWKTAQTVKVLEDHLKWTQEWPSYKLLYPLVSDILNSGGLYIHGRDKRFRPCLVIDSYI